MNAIQEDLKFFFLGLKNGEPFLYKNKDLTTHATIVGMTGSGKTGLGITLIEEACIDNIPSIVIDPKGDMTNLALTFPNLNKSDFLPYIDENEASAKGLSVDEMASKEAQTWQSGIEGSFQNKDRISLLKNSSDIRIYTPKSSSGLSISLLSDFACPSNLDDESLNAYIEAITSSILSLIGIKTENLNSPEVLLLQNIFLENFKKGKDVTIVDLISQITNPPFDKIGAFSLETFFSSDKRMDLAMKLNTLFASPSFSLWCKGERLDISKMLFNKENKARCNIFTISHLSDSERVFFVTLLLNELIRWMRTTEGTNSLRAILYMDEIFGYFPPNANPPTKKPMLTLLKQARAYGVGVVLSTQNPVDLDYKGLSNMGTWFIGRMQTAQDKERVISGLTGISGSSLDKGEIMSLISNLKKREFLVKNINRDGLEVINSRFALNYLKGPLSGEQISNLMKDKKVVEKENVNIKTASKPILSPEIGEVYSYQGGSILKPYLLGTAKVRYLTKEFDYTKDVSLCYFLQDCDETNWDEASLNLDISYSDEKAIHELEYEELPAYIQSLKNLKSEEKSLKDYIYRNIKLELFNALDLNSKPDESKDEFLLRLHDKCNTILEEETEKFSTKFEKEKQRFEQRLLRAEQKLDKELASRKSKWINTFISLGSTIIGAIFGGGKTLTKTNINKAATGAKSVSKVLNESDNIKNAREEVDRINDNLNKIIDEYNEKLKELKESYNIKNIDIKTVEINPKKSDIFDEKVVILWKS